MTADYTNIEIDLERDGQNALKAAQFGFLFAPISTNVMYKPTTNPATGHSFYRLSPEGRAFKDEVYRKVKAQIRRGDSSRAAGWVKQDRPFSLWLIMRKDHKKCEAIDSDNAHKAMQDAFVETDIIPDDRYARDTRQLYADFDRAGWHKDIACAVLIRWVKE